MARLDPIDRKLLTELMRDATQSVAVLAEKVGLTQTPCWKRIQRLEAEGILIGRVALVDPARLGLGLAVFVEIEAADHSKEWRDSFMRAVETMPEVMEVHRMAGDVDYLLRIVVADMRAYDRFYVRLTRSVVLKNVTSRFVMERLLASTVYPVGEEDDEPAGMQNGALPAVARTTRFPASNGTLSQEPGTSSRPPSRGTSRTTRVR